jgi:hypothetical protein
MVGGPDVPVMVSAGGIAYNREHIDYWRERAIKAEAELARLRTPGVDGQAAKE